MIGRTPTTSAEKALAEMARRQQARARGREPSRAESKDGSYAPLVIESPLPVGHPLFDTAEDLRRKRIVEERRRRGL